MCIIKNEETLNFVFEKAKYLCGHMNKYVSILAKFMGKKIGPHILLIESKNFLKDMDHLILSQIILEFKTCSYRMFKIFMMQRKN